MTDRQAKALLVVTNEVGTDTLELALFSVKAEGGILAVYRTRGAVSERFCQERRQRRT